MKHTFFFRQRPSESLTPSSRGLNGGRTGVERTVKRVSNDGRMTLGRVSTLFLLLIALSFGFSSQAWGDNGDFYNVYLAWTYNGTNKAQDLGTSDFSEQQLGTLTSNFNITGAYLKCWDDYGSNYKSSGGQMIYKINNGSLQYWTGFSNHTEKSGNNYEYQKTGTLTIGDVNGASGKYTAEFWFQTWGWGGDNNDRYISNGGGNYKFSYTIAPPAISNFGVTPSGHVAGTGTQQDPFIMPYNGTLILTVASLSQAHTDANSSLSLTGSVKKSSTSPISPTNNVFTVSNIQNTSSTYSVTITAKYHNSTADLDGAESTVTYYFKTERYDVTLMHNDGTQESTSSGVNLYGTNLTKPNSLPSRTGYTLNGFYDDATGSHKVASSAQTPALQASVEGYTNGNKQWIRRSATTLYAGWTANTYRVYLDKGGSSSGVSQVTATYDAAMPSVTAPSLTGYDFAGYYDGQNGTGTKYYNNDMSSAHIWDKAEADVTLYAYYTPKSYTVTLEQTSATTQGATSATVYYNTVPTQVTSLPTRTGYTFGGYNTNTSLLLVNNQGEWQKNVEGFTDADGKWIKTTGATLDPIWNPITTTVTLKANGGKEADQTFTATFDVIVDASAKTPNTRDGYNLSGYYTDATGGNIVLNANLTARASALTGWLSADGKWKNPNTTADLYAQWQAHQWTITLDDNGGTGGDGTKTATYGATTSITSVTKPTRTDYTFAGYEDSEQVLVYNADGNLLANVGTYTDADRNWIKDEAVTLYAKWNSVGNYVVTLNNQSATTAGTTSVNVKINTTTGLTASITCPEKTGYTFGGYFTQTGGNGTQLINADGSWVIPATDYIDNDGKWIKNENVTLSAKWTACQYTVTLDNQEATTAGTESVKVTYNSTSNLTTAITVPTKTGYLFGGYFTEQDGNGSKLINADGTWIKDVTSYTGTYNNNPAWIYANNCTLYAKWTFIDYTVNFVVYPTAGGSITTPAESSITAHYMELFDLEAKENDGYTFGSWTVVPENSIEFGVTDANNAYSPARKVANDVEVNMGGANSMTTKARLIVGDAENITITANFTPITYSITYNGLEDGDVNENPATYTIETETITLADASRTDYTFDGWYDAETEGNKVTSIEQGSFGNKTLWARWHETLHIVNIVESTGIESVSPSGATNVGNVTPVQISAVVKAGYTWKNWTTNHDSYITFGNANENPTTIKATEGTNVYAHATENMTTITINANQTTWGKLQIGSTEQQWGSTRDAGVTTTRNLMAKPNTGYKFKEWQVTEGEGNVQITNAQSASTTVNGTGTANSTATIQAIFEEDLSTPWRLNYGVDGQSGWQQPNFVKRTGESTGKIAYVSVELTGGTTYHFNYVTGESTYKGPENDHAEMPANTEWTFDHAQRAKFIAGVSGTYTFKIDYSGTNPKASYETPSTSGIKGDWTNWAHEDGTVVDNVLTYTHTFNATGEQKFKVVFNGVFYGQENEGGRMTRQNHENWTLTSTNGGKDIYLNVDMVGEYIFTYNSTTNKLSVTYPSETMIPVTVYLNGETASTVEVGEATHPTIEAPQYVNGKRFAGWQADDGVTLANANDRITQITVVTETGKSVRATYNTNYMVYFKNTPGWDNVSVFFYNQQYYDGSMGTGTKIYIDDKGEWVNDVAIGYPMTRLNEKSDIWYYDYSSVDNAYKTGTIAFNDHNDQNGYQYFNNCQASYRTDWDYTHNLSVFVPEKNVTERKNENRVPYYNKGYWMKYNDLQTGYYLRVDGKSGDYEFAAASNGEPYKTTITLEGTQTYNFHINGCNGSYYRNNGEMTSSGSHSGWDFYEGVNDNCRITTSAAGNYTFTLTFGDGILYVSVEYPLSQDDYRVVYTDDSHPCHPSTFIRKNNEAKDTVSFFIDKDKNPALKFQYCSNISGSTVTWADVDGGTIDISSITETGIYNFYLEQTSTSISCTGHELYEGNFYIRTAVAAGGWDAYKGAADNLLPYIEYGLDNSQPFKFTHAYTNWVEANNNVKFCIANDYSLCISDSLVGDDVLGYETNADWLGENGANIRFMWNKNTNELKRAYLSGSTFSKDRFLVLTGDEKLYNKNGTAFPAGTAANDDPRKGLLANETILEDKGNWVYQIDIKAKPSAAGKLTANYNGHVQYFKGSETQTEQIIGGTTSDTQYGIRLVYDFKTNRMVAGWMPSNTQMPIEQQMAIFADVIIIRHEQKEASQITFSGSGKLSEVKTVYGAIEFRKQDMVNKMNTWTETTYKNCMYYISFPFDVKVSEIFGLGTYGDTWLLQYYDGAERASKGWFAETPTFWKDVDFNDTLKANVGYSFLIDRVAFNDGNSTIWKNTANDASVYVYFPSIEEVSGIQRAESLEVTVPEHECKINRTFTVDSRELSHTFTDSHWNMMGVPVFQDVDGSTYKDIFIAEEDDATPQFGYLYAWDYSNNTLHIQNVNDGEFKFKAMHSYMVQYAGKITWTGSTVTPASIAARQVEEPKDYTIDLQLNYNNARVARTYVELREGADADFMLNEDVYMMTNSAAGNIYSLAGSYDVAANVLPEKTQIVPLGVIANKSGEFTFTMPSNFSGTVTLVDKVANTETDLQLMDYTVTLNKGTYEGRFELKLNIERTIGTDFNGADYEGGKTEQFKFIRDNRLHILLPNGRIFNALGGRSK